MGKSLLLLALLSTSLAGCVANDGQRALVGGAIGAVGAQAFGYDPITGLALGAAVGALCDDAAPGICP